MHGEFYDTTIIMIIIIITGIFDTAVGCDSHVVKNNGIVTDKGFFNDVCMDSFQSPVKVSECAANFQSFF